MGMVAAESQIPKHDSGGRVADEVTVPISLGGHCPRRLPTARADLLLLTPSHDVLIGQERTADDQKHTFTLNIRDRYG